MDNTRRTLLGLFALPLLVGSNTHAQSEIEKSDIAGNVPKGFKHFFEREDSLNVFYFFDFSCPVSAAYHIPMLTWAKTAPKPIKTKFIPIVNPYDGQDKMVRSAKAAIFYYSGILSAKSPDQIEAFVTEIYTQRQDRGVSLDSRSLWRDAIKKASFDPAEFTENLAKIEEKDVQYAIDKFLAYQVTESPTATVAGQYSFTPANTNGDPEMFFNILNGLSTQLILS